MIRLEELQNKIDSPELKNTAGPLEQLSHWQTRLQSQSSKKIQEYLDINLQQIAKVRLLRILFSPKIFDTADSESTSSRD